MARFWQFWKEHKDYARELSTTVPLNLDIGTAKYPDSNFESFAKEGYSKNEIVHASILWQDSRWSFSACQV